MSGDEKQSWGIWIDVEGFSNLWSAGDLALRGLTHLTGMIFALGTRRYHSHEGRLFAHQIGDGFYIASDFHEHSLDRCAAIAVALMRGMTAKQCVARAAISEGAIGDYAGCRPRDVRAKAIRRGDSDVVALGHGLMTLQSVLGQGIINAYTLDKIAGKKGSLLTVAAAARERLSAGFVTRPLAKTGEILALDWVHSSSPLIDEIAAAAGFGGEEPAVLETRLRNYVSCHHMADEWRDPTFEFAGL